MTGLERAAYLSLIACLGIGTFSIWGANLVALPGILWLILTFRERRRPDVPPFFWPLAALAAWTLVSCAFSQDPVESFKRSRQLLFFLIVPGTVRLLRGERAMTALNVIIAFGAASALLGILQYAALGYDVMERRPRGTLGHYMTYSGLLMLVACCAAARLIFYRREWIWPAIAVPALLAALLFTNSRNAWIGTAVAVMALLAVRQWKLLLLAPVAAVGLFLVMPANQQQRVRSIVDLNEPTNRDRVAMLQSGSWMVHDYPVFGVGLNLIPKIYLEYRSPLAVDPYDPDRIGPATRATLHNVPMQLAAERGLPALAIWLWFLVIAGRDLLRQLRSGPYETVAAAGLAALAGMFFAGLFEHNFGDSEFLFLFLAIISLPYAAKVGHPALGARHSVEPAAR
jgi:O-antigen ligase